MAAKQQLMIFYAIYNEITQVPEYPSSWKTWVCLSYIYSINDDALTTQGATALDIGLDKLSSDQWRLVFCHIYMRHSASLS